MGASYTKFSAALQRAHDLDLVARGERRGAPFRATNHGAVEGDGEEPCAGVDAARGEQLGDRRRGDLGGLAVDPERGHCAAASSAAGAKRSGLKGRARSERRPVSTNPLITWAETGVSRMPLRWWP